MPRDIVSKKKVLESYQKYFDFPQLYVNFTIRINNSKHINFRDGFLFWAQKAEKKDKFFFFVFS